MLLSVVWSGYLPGCVAPLLCFCDSEVSGDVCGVRGMWSFVRY